MQAPWAARDRVAVGRLAIALQCWPMPRPAPPSPLSDAEVDELDQFLLYAGIEESMTLDMLDGYLHALAIGPERIPPRRWMPRIWGEDHADMAPPVADAAKARRVVALVTRLYDSICARLEDPRGAVIEPLWSSFEDAGVERDDARIWACGFLEAVEMCGEAWQPLLDTREGQEWLRPLHLLGDEDPGPRERALTATPAAREQLTHEIARAVLSMHAYWAASREAADEGDEADGPSS